MSTTKPTLWEGERLTFERSLALTIESLSTYGPPVSPLGSRL